MITFENVTKAYHKELFKPQPIALQNISFTVDKGETRGLIGANGAGKSTAIKLIMDFIRPTSGRIMILNQCSSAAENRLHIGYLPEIAIFPKNLSLLDLIQYTANACGLTKQKRVERQEILLQSLQLWDVRKKRLNTYSKGMQQRASFILALMNDPDLLILDEPMSGLDPLGRELIINLIEGLQKQKKTILFCSHILSDVDRLADTLLVVDKGRLLFTGSPAQFIAQENSTTVEKAYLLLIKNMRSKNCD